MSKEHKIHIALIVMIGLLLVLVGVNVYITKQVQANCLSGKVLGEEDGEEETAPPEKVEVSIDDDAVKGDKNAKVTIVEFSDFQCPYCGRFALQTLPSIRKDYVDTGKVKIVFRDFPLSFHENAQKASEAAECAGEQGKYWEMHDKLFQNQQALDVESLKKYAKEIGLDTAKFNNCLDSGSMASEVKKDFNDGVAYGVTGTPSFFINGQKIVGAQPYEVFKQIIDAELAK